MATHKTINNKPTTRTNQLNAPSALQSWLCADGSLTAKFEGLAGQPLRVELLFEGFRLMQKHQLKDLQLTRAQMVWVREVALYGDDDKPWAVAQSIFPKQALVGKAKRLNHLGSIPLGYVLFKRHKPTCKRAICQNIHDGDTCYTRQNYYHWHGNTILVQETFTKTFEQRIGCV